MAPAKKKPRLIAGTSVHGELKEKSSWEHTTQTLKENLAGLSNTMSVDKDVFDRRKTYEIHKEDRLNLTSDLQEEQLHIAESNTDFTEESIEKVKDGKPGKNTQETNDEDAIPKKRGRKKKATQPSLAKISEKTTAEEEILNANNVSDTKPKKRGRKKKSSALEVGHPLDAVSGNEQSEGVDGSTSDLISTTQSGKQEETNDEDAIPKKRGRKKKATQPSLAKISEKTTAEEEILNANNVSDTKPKKRGRKKKSSALEVGHPLDAVSGNEQSEGVDGSTSDLISTTQSGKQEDKEYEKAAENADVTTDLHKIPAKRGRKKKNP